MPKRILCVDDDRELCNLAARLLADYELVSAHTKAEALTRASAERFDLILLDYQLPDGVGPEVCHFIRTLDKDTPIVFCTATSLLNQQEAIAVGAQGILIKGLAFVENLAPTVSKLLSGKEQSSH